MKNHNSTKILLLLTTILSLALSGGIHRVAQSRWDKPNEGMNKALYLYFSLENALPVGGFLKITLPQDFVHTPETCTAWALETDLDYPADVPGEVSFLATNLLKGTLSGSDKEFFCKWEVELYADTCYGLALARTTSTATTNEYAPISLETRMNTGSTANTRGPVIDTNPVFDSVKVYPSPKSLNLDLHLGSTDPNTPGKSQEVRFSFSFPAFPVGYKIEPPYNIYIEITKPTGTDSIDRLNTNAITWDKYPHTYED